MDTFILKDIFKPSLRLTSAKPKPSYKLLSHNGTLSSAAAAPAAVALPPPEPRVTTPQGSDVGSGRSGMPVNFPLHLRPSELGLSPLSFLMNHNPGNITSGTER